MKHLLLIFMTLAALCAMGVSGFCTGAKGPNAVVHEPDYSFGTVPEGEKTTHTFVIENKGDAVLFIQKVQTG